jgi:DNA ligase-associated metallophosphoesterase
MDNSRLEICPNVWLDSRRAVFLAQEETLAVADLHLGYAWAHRFNGQMLPIHARDPLLERLTELCSFYKPKVIAFLGDIVHQAVPVREVAQEFATLVERLSENCSVRLILGNHDKKLALLKPAANIEFHTSIRTGNFLLLHGDAECVRGTETAPASEELVLMGHEHPAISLGDGIKSAKFPCFLVSETVLILPAFSHWVSGTSFGSYEFMSPLARRAQFRKAIAICGSRLLPVKL